MKTHKQQEVSREQFAQWSFLRDQSVGLYRRSLRFEKLPGHEKDVYYQEAEHYLKLSRQEWPTDILEATIDEAIKVSKLTTAIQSLGYTPETITSKLRELSIKGMQYSACACPIAKYLNACGFSHVTISDRVSLYRGYDMIAYHRHYLPEVIKRWIHAFDNGKYPEFKCQDSIYVP